MISSVSGRPTASSLAQPKVSVAWEFQMVTSPAASIEMKASAVASRISRVRSSPSLSRCSARVRSPRALASRASPASRARPSTAPMASTVRRRSAMGAKAVPVATSAVTVQPRPGTGTYAETARPAVVVRSATPDRPWRAAPTSGSPRRDWSPTRDAPGAARTTPRWSVTVRRTPWAAA